MLTKTLKFKIFIIVVIFQRLIVFLLNHSPFMFMKFIFLKILRIKYGKNFFIDGKCNFLWFGNCEIGDNVIINDNVTIDNRGFISIGDNVSIGMNSSIFTCGHKIVTPKVFFKSPNYNYFKGKVIIKNNIFIFANCIIQPNIEISSNSFIYPNSVVTKTFKSYSVLAGIPAKVIKSFDES